MLPVIDLRGPGDPGELGARYGRDAADRIRRSVDFYRWLLPAALGRSWASLGREIGDLMEVAATATPATVELLARAARAAGVPSADLAVVSCRSELLARTSVPAPECTVVRRGRTLAQTWDWFTTQRDACVVLRTDRALTFTEAGMPAKIGLNVAGLGISLNFLATTPPPTAPGLPVHLLIADLLNRAGSVAEAATRIGRHPVACSATIGLVDTTGAAAFVELTPHDPPVVLDAADSDVHTNHCIGPGVAGRDVPGPLLDHSRVRLRRARELLAHGLEPQRVLTDTADPASCIDVPPRPDASSPVALGTVAAVVMDVAGRAMVVSPDRPSVSGFVQRLRLDG